MRASCPEERLSRSDKSKSSRGVCNASQLGRLRTLGGSAHCEQRNRDVHRAVREEGERRRSGCSQAPSSPLSLSTWSSAYFVPFPRQLRLRCAAARCARILRTATKSSFYRPRAPSKPQRVSCDLSLPDQVYLPTAARKTCPL